MPEAKIVIVMNERAGPFVGDATREGRTYRDELTPLLERYAHVKMPLAGAKSIAAFASSRRSIPEIMAATDEELRQWSGLPLLAARSCQTHISAFWLAVTSQLEKVLPFRAVAQRSHESVPSAGAGTGPQRSASPRTPSEGRS